MLNKQKIVAELEKMYPGKPIVCIPEDAPEEIVCEFEPTGDHPEWSKVMAIVGKSALHYHKNSTETYEVVRGKLAVFLDGKKQILNEGETLTIYPGQQHYAESANENENEETWFLTSSRPGWTEEDHIIL